MNPPTPPETITQILTLAQLTPRITQTEIARRCGVTQGFVSRICNDREITRRPPRVDHDIIVNMSRTRTHAEVAERIGYHPSTISKIVQAYNNENPNREQTETIRCTA